MGKLINLLRGTVTLTAHGLFPERLLNLCAQQAIPCWRVEWADEHTLRMTVHRERLRRLRQLAQRAGCEIEVEGKRGLPVFLGRFRRRYTFLVGLAFALTAICFLSRFILTIEVTGNEQVPTARILSELHRLGARPGAYGPGLDRKQIAQQALLELEELSWMSINRYGTRLEVVVREAVPMPELLQEEGCYDIVAETDGMILHLEPTQGDAVVEEGDTVAKGEVLISGVVALEPPQYSDLPVRYYQTHARGRVYARTWRNFQAVLPIQTEVKRYTGEAKTLWSLKILDNTVDFFQNSSISWPSYDKITEVHQLTLPGGRRLPMMLTAQRCRAYDTEVVSVDLEAAREMLEGQMLQHLRREIGADGQIHDIRFSDRVVDGMLEVVLTAECWEEIGMEVPNIREIPGDAPMEQEKEHQ